jgi:hypothetical protein
MDKQHNKAQPPLVSPAGQVRAVKKLEQIMSGFAALGALQIKAHQLLSSIILGALSGEQIPLERAPYTREQWEKALPLLVERDQAAKFQPARADTKIRQQSLQIEAIVRWMRLIDPQGERLRIALKDEARAIFGSQMTDRMFNAAYKAAFNRPRGRPRRTK